MSKVRAERYTTQELTKALRLCAQGEAKCLSCPLYNMRGECYKESKTLAADRLEELAGRIAELEAQLILRQDELLREREKHRWIPVEERLPEISEFVLTLGKEGVCEGCWPGTGWWRLTMGISTKEVTHWTPMPDGVGAGD